MYAETGAVSVGVDLVVITAWFVSLREQTTRSTQSEPDRYCHRGHAFYSRPLHET